MSGKIFGAGGIRCVLAFALTPRRGGCCIQNVRTHHATNTFRDENAALLEKFGRGDNQRYVFKTDD